MNKRIKNKVIKRSIVMYDVSSIPEGLEIERVFDVYIKSRVLLYDSKLGSKPYLFPKRNNKAVIFTDSYKK